MQQQQIKGKITDVSGRPLPGVNILIVGTTNGTQADSEGNYTISTDAGSTLQFSFVGMETQLILVGNQTIINVVMKDDTKLLNQVVVVGWYSAKK